MGRKVRRSGGEVVRKKDTPKRSSIDEAAAFKRHVEERIGSCRSISEEATVNGYSWGIAVIDPTPEYDFYTIVTIGVGALKMGGRRDDAMLEMRRAEFMMCLREDWMIDSEDEEWSWPFDWLRSVARFALEHDLPAAWDDPIPAGSDVQDTGGFCGSALLPPMMLDDMATACLLPNGEMVALCHVVPLYEEEFECALEEGVMSVLKEVGPDGVMFPARGRANVCGLGGIGDKATFSERVERFWRWFSENEGRLSDMVDGGSLEGLQHALDEGGRQVSIRQHMEIGNGRKLHFLTNGSSCRFYLLPYLVSRMPEEHKGKWDILPYSPGRGEGHYMLDSEDLKKNAHEISVFLSDDPAGGGLCAGFYSEVLPFDDEFITLILLDVMMGAFAGDLLPHLCVSRKEILKSPVEGMFPLAELKGRLEGYASENIDMLDPSGCFTLHEREPDFEHYMRSDITKAVTCYPELTLDPIEGLDAPGRFDEELEDSEEDDYGGVGSEWEDDDLDDECPYDASSGQKGGYFPGNAYYDSRELGALPGFIYFASDDDTDALLEECRGIASSLEEGPLGKRGSGEEKGIILGYAAGEQYGYIDVMIYDPLAFLEAARTTLGGLGHVFCFSPFSMDLKTHICTGDVPDIGAELDMLEERDDFEIMLSVIDDHAPEEEWGYDISIRYAEALLVCDDPEYALEFLEGLEGEGAGDEAWNAAMGEALFSLGRDEEAVGYLQASIDLGGGDGGAEFILGVIERDREERRAGKKRGVKQSVR